MSWKASLTPAARCVSALRQEDANLRVPAKVQAFIDENVAVCQPDDVYVCDGTEAEFSKLIGHLTDEGVTHPLKTFPNRYSLGPSVRKVFLIVLEEVIFIVIVMKDTIAPSVVEMKQTGEFPRSFLLTLGCCVDSYLVRTDPADVARVESKTFISTANRRDTIPTPAEGVDGKLGKWLSPGDMENTFNDRFPGCMKGLCCC